MGIEQGGPSPEEMGIEPKELDTKQVEKVEIPEKYQAWLDVTETFNRAKDDNNWELALNALKEYKGKRDIFALEDAFKIEELQNKLGDNK